MGIALICAIFAIYFSIREDSIRIEAYWKSAGMALVVDIIARFAVFITDSYMKNNWHPDILYWSAFLLYYFPVGGLLFYWLYSKSKEDQVKPRIFLFIANIFMALWMFSLACLLQTLLNR